MRFTESPHVQLLLRPFEVVLDWLLEFWLEWRGPIVVIGLALGLIGGFGYFLAQAEASNDRYPSQLVGGALVGRINGYPETVWRIQDPEKGVTCWAIAKGGLACLPNSQLQSKVER